MLKKLKQNWKSGITVSLISIPLSISLAVASEATPIEGIITAVWAGIMASFFGGSNYNIVGPTGALSGLLAAYTLSHGYGLLPMLAIITGIFVFIAYFLKLEKYLVLIPASTIHGFTLGVALIIGLGQLNFAFGLTGLTKHEKFIENLWESLSHLGNYSQVSVIIFVIFLAALILIRKVMPKIPGAIILSPIGIALGMLSTNGTIPLNIQTLTLKYPDISPKLFQMPQFYINYEVVVAAFTVSIIAILETMISAKIADGMTKTKHNKRKEMLGLGIANIASGLMGGIPATAALARTSLNIKTGANNKISATISSISIVIISFFLISYFKYIPLAVIAAILVYVAINMIETEHFKRMFQIERKNFAVAFIVAAITIIEDPIIGILVGTVISLLMFVDKLRKGQFEIMLNDSKKLTGTITGEDITKIDDQTETLVYSIKGPLNYINGQAHINRFENHINGQKNVILRLREVHFIDLDGLDVIEEIIKFAEEHHMQIFITSVNSLLEPILVKTDWYEKLQKENKVFNKTKEALSFLGYKL